MVSKLEVQRVRQIAAASHLVAREVRYLATGATSEVWRVVSNEGLFVVRIGKPHPGKKNLFEADAGLRKRLLEIDQRIAEPVATRHTCENPEDVIGIEWAIDRFIPGVTARRGAIPDQVCRDLGELLANLHSLPAEGYGRLENRRDRIAGTTGDVVAGINTRFQDPWPFTEQPLAEHALTKHAPELTDHLLRLKEPLLAEVMNSRSAPVHADLHEQQLLLADNRLAALIDFGDAMVGWPAWDVASFAYFHGWQLTERLLEGYSSDKSVRELRREQALRLSITIALHHASRSVTLKRPRRMRAAVTFLRITLPKFT